VNKTLVDLEEKIRKATKIHNGFLRELGLKELPGKNKNESDE
jgi:hypothetical protein